MIKTFWNIVSGKNAAFYDTFRVPHQRARMALGELPAPSNAVQLAFLQRTQSFLDATCEFTHALFFGFMGRPAVSSDAELRGIGTENGERLFQLLCVSMVRYSLTGDLKIGDSFCEILHLIRPTEVSAAAERLAVALRTSNAQQAENGIVGIVRQILPDVAENPARRIQFVAYLTVFAAILSKQTFGALEEAARAM